ncbi:MAG: hypothetical protein Q9222_005427 [Ikaeria aurantiellina]
MTFTPKSPAFEKAIKDSRNLKAKPTDDELLDLYSLFKQGTQDPPFAEAAKPGMFDLKVTSLSHFYPSSLSPYFPSCLKPRAPGKAKYNAWKKVADEEMTAKQAQEKYVTLVGEMKGKYGFEG